MNFHSTTCRGSKVGRAGLLEVSAAKDNIINGTLGLGHVAAGTALEAAEEMVRLVRVGMEVGATWRMCAGRALQVRSRVKLNMEKVVRIDTNFAQLLCSARGRFGVRTSSASGMHGRLSMP